MPRPRVLSSIKHCLVPAGRHTRYIPCGLFHGLKFNIDLRSQMQLYLGLWERETHNYIKSRLYNVQWFIDVGAGSGELCLLFKKTGTKTVVAAEPATSEVDLLHQNFLVNGLDPSELLIITKCIGTNCDCIRLDEIKVDLRESGCIKIDVDGSELDVLKSGVSLLSLAADLTILLETHSKDLEDNCKQYLECCGFQTNVIPNAWWRFVVPELRPLPHNRWIWAKKGVAPDTSASVI
jgi:hypothetical protein